MHIDYEIENKKRAERNKNRKYSVSVCPCCGKSLVVWKDTGKLMKSKYDKNGSVIVIHPSQEMS
jgi:hypothetical protein